MRGRKKVNWFFNLFRRKQPVNGKLNFFADICKGRFGNNIIAVAVKSSFAKLLPVAAGRMFNRIGMIGQPVMKNNGRCNTEGKYDQENNGYNFFYDKAFDQCLFFLLQCCKYSHSSEKRNIFLRWARLRNLLYNSV